MAEDFLSLEHGINCDKSYPQQDNQQGSVSNLHDYVNTTDDSSCARTSQGTVQKSVQENMQEVQCSSAHKCCSSHAKNSNSIVKKPRSVVTLDDLSRSEIVELLHKAEYIDNNRRLVSHTCDGRVLATLFYEPSTRTRLSFETAMLRLGGSVIGFAGAQLSSVSKGETISDTLHTVSQYVDIVAIRHPREGAALVASDAVNIPVINAGDGGHMHPTQTLADLATLKQRCGRINHLTVGLCGDLTYGRTVHSLIETLCRFDYVDFVLISPSELTTPEYVLRHIRRTQHCTYRQVSDLTSVIGDLDVLYMTRVQQERFASQEEYLRLRDTYILDSEKMDMAQPHMIVLHPLPRVNEISVDVDKDPRAAYFDQVRNGMLMRMALESTLLGDELEGFDLHQVDDENLGNFEASPDCPLHIPQKDQQKLLIPQVDCSNVHCVTQAQTSLEHLFAQDEYEKDSYHCYYCDTPVELTEAQRQEATF